MNVAVVGGGVVGLACAWYLRRAGARVTVFERGRCGGGVSGGNAGWIAPAFATPLSGPGVPLQVIRWSLTRRGPLALRRRPGREIAAWGLRFLSNCRTDRHRSAVRALAAFGAPTAGLFDDLRREVEFDVHEGGALFLFRSASALADERRLLDGLARVGYEGAITEMNGDDVRALEPVVSDCVIGAIHVEDERFLRPEKLVMGLADALRRSGAVVLEGTGVDEVEPNGRWIVHTSAGAHTFDSVVIAAGVWTNELLAPHGVRLSQVPAKGYSVTCAGRGIPPQHALYLSEAKVAVSPFPDGVRLAGRLELTDIEARDDPRSTDAVIAAARAYLTGWEPSEQLERVAGMRPLTSDGLPYIGAVPGRDGLFVATGHGMLGVTLAPATGAALAPLVLEGRRCFEIVPMGLDR